MLWILRILQVYSQHNIIIIIIIIITIIIVIITIIIVYNCGKTVA